MTYAAFTTKTKPLRIFLHSYKQRINLFSFFSLFVLFLTTRLYNLPNRLGFDHDQEKAAEAAWNIIVERKLSLIGIETSTGGLFAGPFLNWTHAVFLYLFKLDPIALGYQAVLFSTVSVILLFFLVKEIYGPKQALFAIFTYTVSARLISYDISASPISYILTLSILTIYLTYKVSCQRKLHLFPILTFILSLGYHVHFTLLTQIPAVTAILLLNKTRFTKSQILFSSLTFFLPLSTYLIFEFRHNFLMSRNIISLLITNNLSNSEKIINTIYNFFATTTETIIPIRYSILTITLLVILSTQVRARLNRIFFKEILIFLFTPLLCLLIYKGHIPDYYFLVATPAAIIIISNLYYGLTKKMVPLITLFLFVTIFINFQSSIFYLTNPFSINLKKSIVEYIKKDSQKNEISVNYEMPASLNYGFKYLFKWSNVSLNNRSEKIYIIDYPQEQEFNLTRYQREGEVLESATFGPLYVISLK